MFMRVFSVSSFACTSVKEKVLLFLHTVSIVEIAHVLLCKKGMHEVEKVRERLNFLTICYDGKDLRR